MSFTHFLWADEIELNQASIGDFVFHIFFKISTVTNYNITSFVPPLSDMKNAALPSV